MALEERARPSRCSTISPAMTTSAGSSPSAATASGDWASTAWASNPRSTDQRTPSSSTSSPTSDEAVSASRACSHVPSPDLRLEAVLVDEADVDDALPARELEHICSRS